MPIRSKTVRKAHDPVYREHHGNKTNLHCIVEKLREITPEHAYAVLRQWVINGWISRGDAQFLAHIAHGAGGELKGMKSRMRQSDSYILPGMHFIEQRRKKAAKKTKKNAKPVVSKKKWRK